MNIIEVKNLKKYYKGIKAVDGINIEVKKGYVVAILGPNGAGKTTTVETLEGLRVPTSGEIYYFGEKINVVDEKIKEKIGVQLQSTNFFTNLTVHETLKAFSGLYKKTVDVNELLKKFNLIEKKKSRIKNLSGGQLQRVALATAVVNDPEIVFLDEPTTGLDPQARRNLWDAIIELKKNGKTIILTTHYMEEAEKLADMIYIIDHGKIILKGTVKELIENTKMKSVITFYSEKNIKIDMLDLKNINGFYELETNDVESDIIKILEYSKEKGHKIEDISIRKPNLEDVFLQLTGRTLRE
ncbi:ABC transporter ATP-binding protein [Tepiditoga spiralis]|uniref:ABC transporter ATP-binding protein n=1 Tax=Tepiditoga spiralis TaxID=2108365 RepID=A0A7G1G7C3_9BACT|nr:ABC transporter ATP-binding protein [Tepiditoga spiralis]BBE29922.1 ABC transporter ATP-binding protein [Tepiditoga spiralis]